MTHEPESDFRKQQDALVVFRLIPSGEFSYAHLDDYHVWAEFYDPEEREEIIRWGIDAAWLDRELAQHHDGSNHAVYPLLETIPFPSRELIYVKARFQTPTGLNLSGYLLYAYNEYVRAVFLCHAGKEFGFNRNLLDLGRKTEADLRQHLPDPAAPIFPLSYQTDFTDWDGLPFAGQFDFIVP